jgi:hypothetical protein
MHLLLLLLLCKNMRLHPCISGAAVAASLTDGSSTPAAPSMAQRAFCSSACTILQASAKQTDTVQHISMSLCCR